MIGRENFVTRFLDMVGCGMSESDVLQLVIDIEQNALSSQWIRVDDKLPPIGESVDIWVRMAGGHNFGDGGRVENVFYDEGYWWTWDVNGENKICVSYYANVLYWMPRPQDPEQP